MQVNWTEVSKNTTACYISILLIVLSVIFYYFKNKDIPPGPIGLPYFGYWPFLKYNACHLQLQELGRKYGDVFSFTATGHLFINLGSFKSNREAFVSKIDCFSKRPQGYSVDNRIFRGSIIVLDGEEWKTNKAFFAQQFKERGISNIKGHMCGPMYDAIKETVEELRNTHASPTDIINMLKPKCTKILFQICFGEGGITEQEMKDLIEAYQVVIENINGPTLIACGTFARYFIFPFAKTFQKMLKSVIIMEHLLQKIVDRNRETFDGHTIRNFFDAYHKEKLDRISKNDPTAQHFKDFILVGSLIEFIGDGIFAIAAFIGTYLYNLVQYPEDQEKIYQELVNVVGTGRNPSVEDRSKLSYTNAFISEIMRTTDSLPFYPKLQCTREVTIGGYRIPKGAIMLANMWNCNQDPKVYEDPEKFNPSRFLSKNEKNNLEQPMFFGIGKHSCMGENYTLVQVFLFITTILKNFRMEKAENSKNETSLYFNEKVFICAHARTD